MVSAPVPCPREVLAPTVATAATAVHVATAEMAATGVEEAVVQPVRVV